MRYLAILCAAACLVSAEPVRIIFDTDMGNDVDDVIALAEIHAFESRGEAKLLAVTITKDNRWAPVFVDLMDTYYGRADVPIGIVKGGKTPEDGNYLRQVAESSRYPHRIMATSDVPDAVTLLKKTLAAQPDGSVVIVQVGFSTNLARLLESAEGRQLAAKKVRLVSMMAGDFRPERIAEYNINQDIPAAQKLFRDWPGPIVTSAFDIGLSIAYPANNIEADFRYAEHNPLTDAYRAYKPMPYDEPLWDPTAVLYAVRPNDGYFTTSQPGTISVDEKGKTSFSASPDGKQRYLIVNDTQRARVREAISILASQPPGH